MPDTPPPPSAGQNVAPKWTLWHTLSLLVIVVAILAVGLTAPLWSRLWAWISTLLLFAAFLAVTGQGIVGRWSGALVDDRNKMSLSRFQMILWTIVILSAILMAALSNIAARAPDPLAIAIPSQLWLLMGISTTSLVGSPLLKSSKMAQSPNNDQMARTLDLLAKQQGLDSETMKNKVDNQGQILVNLNSNDAQVSDMFKGEETGNAAHLDLAKVQMFYFTLVLVLAYAVTLGNLFGSVTGKIGQFPDVDSSLTALLGISHAGYLVNKAIPHSQS